MTKEQLIQIHDALKWMIDNDDTNEGDELLYELGNRSWNEYNAYWIEGLNNAREALKVLEGMVKDA